MIDHIPELILSGVDSLKIEGRMKTALYVATVARTYRMAIDDFFEDPEKYKENIPKYIELMSQGIYRQYTTGFFFGKPDENSQVYDKNDYEHSYTYLGIIGQVDEDGMCHFEQRNKFSIGDEIEVMKPDGRDIKVKVSKMMDEEGNEVESAPHPKQKLKVFLDNQAEVGDLIRMKSEE